MTGPTAVYRGVRRVDERGDGLPVVIFPAGDDNSARCGILNRDTGDAGGVGVMSEMTSSGH